MKTTLFIVVLLITFGAIESNAQVDVYRSGGGEVIFSGADIRMTPPGVYTG